MIRIVFVILILASCAPEIERMPLPDQLIERDKMVEIVKELTKTEGHVQNRYGQVSKYYRVMINSGDSLLKSYGVSREQFEASMDYYGSRQEEMSSIYDQVINELNEELGELQSEQQDEASNVE